MESNIMHCSIHSLVWHRAQGFQFLYVPLSWLITHSHTPILTIILWVDGGHILKVYKETFGDVQQYFYRRDT